jgi:putative membrane protein
MEKSTKKYNTWIIILSIAIPLLVAGLFSVKMDIELPIFLPPIYATINAVTAVLLIVAFWAIKSKKIELHKKLMKTAIVFSMLFLLLYVLYHMTSNSTKFGGEGILRTVYFILLISHILLSILVIPFVLITYVRAITNNIDLHKKIAKFTFPIWLYVAISGVLVYLFISPYYIH